MKNYLLIISILISIGCSNDPKNIVSNTDELSVAAAPENLGHVFMPTFCDNKTLSGIVWNLYPSKIDELVVVQF